MIAAYAPGVGLGFVKDDFSWIQQSTVASASQLPSLFTQNNGFYRPLVALSFALDRALFNLAPMGYGLTNALLLVLAALAIARLARALALPPAAAALAACLWCLNPDGINMALLWTSGRTSLLLTLFAVLAATAVVRGSVVTGSLLALCAMLSKEEAVVLPFVFLAWAFISKASKKALVLPFVALAVYLALRWNSGAFTPSSAPPFYRFTGDARMLAANLLSYVNRAAAFSVVAALGVTLIVRQAPPLGAAERRLAAMGAVWLAAGYALTIWLPVRSSLYACFPSVGVVLIAAMWISAVVSRAKHVPVAAVTAALLVIAAVAVPVYWARNDRWVAPGRVSAAVLAQLKDIVAAQPAGTTVVIRDRQHPRESMAAAFGTLLPEAVVLVTGRRDVSVWLDPPPGDWQLAGWRPP